LPHFSRFLSGGLASATEDSVESGGYVVRTLEASVWCLLATRDFVSALLKAVNLGGDTDTTGAVTGGLAGLCYGEKAIPGEWLGTLARREDIENLARRFAEAVPDKRST
jgi:ADP-ribosylglycohydrolase